MGLKREVIVIREFADDAEIAAHVAPGWGLPGREGDGMWEKIKAHGASFVYAVIGVILGAWYLGVVKVQQQAGLHFDPFTSFVAGLPSWFVIIVILAIGIGPGLVSFTGPVLSKWVVDRFRAAAQWFTASYEAVEPPRSAPARPVDVSPPPRNLSKPVPVGEIVDDPPPIVAAKIGQIAPATKDTPPAPRRQSHRRPIVYDSSFLGWTRIFGEVSIERPGFTDSLLISDLYQFIKISEATDRSWDEVLSEYEKHYGAQVRQESAEFSARSKNADSRLAYCIEDGPQNLAEIKMFYKYLRAMH
jgi:hypothetical protein